MTEKTTYLPGEPIWVDLGSPDLAASTAFYGALLGWTAEAPQEQFGGYASWLKDGRKVAGLMPLTSPEQPPSWTLYLCTDDADKTAALVQEAGGTVVAPPMDVGDLGRMAVFTDATGSFVGSWQPGTHRGADLVEQDGAMAWVELTSRAPADAALFYETVFGLSAHLSPEYVELQLSGRSVAGVTDTSQGTDPGWIPYFGASDPAASARQAADLGGTVIVPFMEFPGGTCAIVVDPHGATFGLLRAEGA